MGSMEEGDCLLLERKISDLEERLSQQRETYMAERSRSRCWACICNLLILLCFVAIAVFLGLFLCTEMFPDVSFERLKVEVRRQRNNNQRHDSSYFYQCAYQDSWTSGATITFDRLMSEGKNLYESGGFVLAKGKFNAPVRGVYQISYGMVSEDREGKLKGCEVKLHKNNKLVKETRFWTRTDDDGAKAFFAPSRSFFLTLSRRDTLHLQSEHCKELKHLHFCVKLENIF